MGPKLVPVLMLAAATTTTASTLANVLDAHNNTLSILNNFLAGQEALFAALSTAEDITVLAPSNDALNKLAADAAVMDAMAAKDGMVAAFLKYHVFQGVWYTSNFTSPPPPPFPAAGAAGMPIITTLMNDTAFVNITGGQRVSASVDPSTGLVSFLSGNANAAAIQSGNYNWTGGTIHIIDSVLTMPGNISDTLVQANLTAAEGAFSRGGLTQNINEENEITIFAPSNAGFNAVGSAIAGMSVSEIASLMGYHVIKGKVLYTAMMKNGTETTSEGNEVHLRVMEEGGEIFVNSAKIIKANLFTSNGVVHVCDNVLNPQNANASPNPSLATQAPAFNGATSTNSIPFTSGVRTPTPTSAAATATVTAVVNPYGGSGGGGGGSAPATAAGFCLRCQQNVGERRGLVGVVGLLAGIVILWEV